MSEYADPACTVCGGVGFVYGESMLDGGRTCDCTRRTVAAAYWEQQYPGATRERLIVDEHSGPVLQMLDELTVRADADPVGVLLVGRPGRGKTAPAVATGRRLATEPPFPTARVVRHADWLGALRSSYQDGDGPSLDELIEDAARPTVLVIDDVGADERPTDFARGVTVRLLEARVWRRGLITILTSNFRVGDPRWDDHLDERGVSRLLGLCRGRCVQVAGPDRRLCL